MNLGTLIDSKKNEGGAVLHLMHPVTGEPLFDEETKEPVTITLAGRDSDRYKAAERRVTDRRLQIKITRGRKMKVTSEMIEEDGIEVLAECTLEWKHIKLDVPLQCSASEAKRLYKSQPWIKDQVDEFVTDRSNYLGNS